MTRSGIAPNRVSLVSTASDPHPRRAKMRGDDRRDDRRDRSYSGRDRPPSRDGDAARRRGEVDEFGRPLRRPPRADSAERKSAGASVDANGERRGWKRARSRSRSRSPGPVAKRGRDTRADSVEGDGRGVSSVPPPPARRLEVPPPPPPSDAPPPPPDDAEAEMMALMGFGGFGSTAGKQVDDPNANVSAVRKKTTRKARQYMNRPGGFNRPLPEEKTGIKQNKI